MSVLRTRLPKSWLTYILIITFGIGSWVAINGIWAEISVLVIVTPECNKFPALVVVVIQIANVGPVFYTVTKYLFMKSKWSKYQFIFDSTVIMILVGIGVSSTIFLSLFWSRTSRIFGSEHSVALLVLTFFLSLVDCTSSVVFIPFMTYFPELYLSALYIGEGLSGVLPTILSLIQGSVKNDLKCNSSGFYTDYQYLGISYSLSIYFLALSAMMAICGISFVMIISLPLVHRQMIHNGMTIRPGFTQSNQHIETNNEDIENNIELLKMHRCCQCTVPQEQSLAYDRVLPHPQKNTPEDSLAIVKESYFSLRKIAKIMYQQSVLYVCLGMLSMLSNGALGSISSFAFLPYGNSVYHVAVNLGLLATPIMSMFFLIIPSKSKVVTAMITAISILLGIYIIDNAVLYPTPLLYKSLIGKMLIVSLNAVYVLWDYCYLSNFFVFKLFEFCLYIGCFS